MATSSAIGEASDRTGGAPRSACERLTAWEIEGIQDVDEQDGRSCLRKSRAGGHRVGRF
jgi:hypothetical protein